MGRRKEESSSIPPTALKGKTNRSYTKDCPVRKTLGVSRTGKEAHTPPAGQAGDKLCCASIISLSHFFPTFPTTAEAWQTQAYIYTRQTPGTEEKQCLCKGMELNTMM